VLRVRTRNTLIISVAEPYLFGEGAAVENVIRKEKRTSCSL